jgi:hypothetical protein
MKSIATTALAGALLLATNSVLAQVVRVGEFVTAAPIHAQTPELSMRWQFALRLNLAWEEIDEFKFACAQIPGSVFTVKRDDMRRQSGGVLSIDGPIVPVSNKATPWLFEASYTFVTCNATIQTVSRTQAVVSTRLNYTEEMKTATLQKLKAAHEQPR